MAGRVRHPIDVKALERYIEEHVPEIKTPLEVKQQFGYGQSNPTYQLTSPSGHRYVLRKKPPGKLLSKAAHKVEREHRIIAALWSTDVPVPRAYCLCEDASVIGTPFYIMSFLDGRIIEDPAMPEASSGGERAALWRAAVETLAKFHRVDFRGVGLGNYGKSDGFYDRQLATWKTICTAQAATEDVETRKPVGQLPHFDGFLKFFSDKMKQPADRGTLIHGDYKIDNIVFHKTEPRVIGILDWEMSTVGHPLSDLANMMIPLYTATMKGEAKYSSSPAFLPGATPGLPTPEVLMKWYADTAGWDPRPDINWGMSFAIFRLSAICQGIAARVAQRQASSEQAKKHSEALGPLAEFAWELVGTEKDQVRPAAKL
ncbi:phosphotransferase enzyme family protein [Truncatella angustata]|uniref:Phosphotransferase enzyme family protein n=1 Tax=Truncatella angustata TaxID=152316 RepID=A0A9P8UX71_9PEZI|nr:phosphotransferase enzyme family protein [Truncatella angustata]KAH6660191.1 phosphotransferase enzyme family protein [Truncatella angustata]